jgi:serine protease AprX
VRRALLAVGLAVGLLAGGLTVAPAVSAADRVVVQGPSASAAARAVTQAGGRVLRRLDVVDGVAAELPAGASLPGFVITPDEPLRPQSTDSSGSGTTSNVYRQEVRAINLQPPSHASTVALVDTGISDVGGLGARTLTVPDPVTGQPAPCANFSSEAGDCTDSYGHGTFLAGLIAGSGSYPGLDPNARLVSVKIAGADGTADTSSVLAAIQWVVSFKDQLGINVLNLSLGTDSNHDLRKDPLNRAVEKAWRAGIVVVVAASNRGPDQGTISKPGDDPLVVTVGAVDDQGTTSISDDQVAPFSGRGPVSEGTSDDPIAVLKPDVVAPGVGLISLAAPGSTIDTSSPPSSVGAGYRRGSGTSQSTAVVSGVVALLLERRTLTPDEVKAALTTGAHHLSNQPSSSVGAGVVDLDGSLAANVAGSLQQDPRQDPYDAADPSAADYASGPWTGQSWYASPWVQGQSWYGQSWYGQSWYGQSWYEAWR